MKQKFCAPFLAIFIMLFLNACSDSALATNPDNKRIYVGSGIGLAGGILVAGVVGTSPPLALGAGAAGAAAGYFLSKQKFGTKTMHQIGGSVFQVGNRITINIPMDNLFEPGKSIFMPDATQVLASAVAIALYFPNSNILITANTSNIGTKAFQRKLSNAQAKRVANFFAAHGVGYNTWSQRKLQYAGIASDAPIANHIKGLGIAQNRRIQINIYPTKVQLATAGQTFSFGNIGAYHG